MKYETEYLLFEEDPDYALTHKTSYWTVRSVRHGDLLGDIKWYGPWRQYVFEPFNAIFNKQCLNDISTFIEARMQARKKVK